MALTLEVGYFNSFYVKRIAGFSASGQRIPLPSDNNYGTPTTPPLDYTNSKQYC